MEYLDLTQARCEKLELLPLSLSRVDLASRYHPKEDAARIADIFRKHGWPSSEFTKEAFALELSQLCH